jgi:diguanylate cyclase (GGDEF)-like protein/PAS domain S-box-containing protein
MDGVLNPSSYTFSWYSLPLLIVGGLGVIYALAIFSRERATIVGQAFLLMVLVTDTWLLSFAAIYSTNNPAVAFFWVRVEHIGVMSIPAAVLLFTTAVTGRFRTLWPVVLAAAAFSVISYALVFSTDRFIVGMHHYYWGYYPIYGWPFLAFVAFFGLVLTASLQMFRTGIEQTSSETQRRRLQAIWLALLIADVGSVDYLPAFHVPVYPFGYIFIGLFILLATRAIWRYRLVDITPAFAANEIVEMMADALVVFDREGIIRAANSAAATMLATSSAKMRGISAEEFDRTWFDGALGGLESPEALRNVEITFHGADGTTGTALIAASVVRDKAGERQATVCIVHDISERKRAEQVLQEREALYRTLIETSPDAVLVAERDGSILMANRRAAELVGLGELEEARGRNAREFVAPQDQERLSESFAQASGSAVIRDVEYTLVTKDGRLIPAELSVSRVPGAAGSFNGIMAVARDISERKRAEETIRHLAFHDPLTGVANRSVLMEALDNALAQARRQGHMLGLLFLDLDNFKEINDTAGHAAGDETLRQAANALLQLVREGETLARMGGDEFVILLPQIAGVAEAASVAERVITCLRPGGTLRGEFGVTASVGIAVYPTDGADSEALLRNADLAMYAAKSGGGDTYQLATDLPGVQAA